MNDVDSVLIKREGESDLAYHRRLVYGKLVDKTLSDYDYSELSSYIYDKEYSADVARRMLYGSCKTLQLMDEEGSGFSECMTPDSVAADIEARMTELRKERQRFFDQRREYNKFIANGGRTDHLRERIAEAAGKLSETVGTIYDFYDGDTGLIGESEAVLVLSDWHYGMVTNNIFNKYNTDICRERVQKVIDNAIARCNLHGCSRLHVVVLGDLIHGAIHVSARVASEELACDQLMQASEILAQSIQRLSQFIPDIRVYLTYGNHARTVANKNESIHRDNMERIVGWWLRERFRGNDGISVMQDSDNEFILIDSCGHSICAAHGDLDSVKGSPRLLTALFQKRYGRDVEYIIIGDKHHRESFDELGVTASICGSLCGTDDYANEKRLYAEPSQMLLIVNRENGVDAEYRLKC